MFFLTNQQGIIIDIAQNIILQEPFIKVNKIKIINENEIPLEYNFMAQGKNIYNLEIIPQEIIPQKYMYINSEFILNPNYRERNI